MTKEIQLVNRQGVALVDDEDYDRLSGFRWYRHSAGYAVRNIRIVGHKRPVSRLMHQDIIEVPGGHLTDHRNGNRLDNQRHNLRVATKQLNSANQVKKHKATSQYKGVMRSGVTGRWVAQIYCNGKRTYLGTFGSEIEAADAYNRAALATFGEFANINNIPQED